ncbi:hypothetical protein ACHAPN_006760 [Verticillium nonalfalfae]
MSIARLPDAATRQLCATLVLVSPSSAVKELLDNALDAGATAVEVLISANTLGRIQVRDNGHGIAPEDIKGVGRPGHTSKLRSFEELQFKGGKTLGFRGSALSSAACISKVVITTRTAQDKVASAFILGSSSGDSVVPKTVSAPVGTTVELSNLYSDFPVRRKVFFKEAPKSIASIKTLLQAYALARPETKLTFKVLGGEKSAWSATGLDSVNNHASQ